MPRRHARSDYPAPPSRAIGIAEMRRDAGNAGGQTIRRTVSPLLIFDSLKSGFQRWGGQKVMAFVANRANPIRALALELASGVFMTTEHPSLSQ